LLEQIKQSSDLNFIPYYFATHFHDFFIDFSHAMNQTVLKLIFQNV